MEETKTSNRAGRIVAAPDAETKYPELGKIKVGAKIPHSGGRDIPTSLDYFIAKGKYEDKFNEAYPDKPTAISIIFPTDNLRDVCNERFECRNPKDGSLVGKGDGLTFHIWHEGKKEYRPYVADDDKSREIIKNAGKWDHILTLRFVIPKISSVFGLWRFETKAKASSIPNIRDTFDNVMNMAGTVVNVPFDLTVQKVKSQKPGEKVLFPVVNLVPNLGLDKIDEIYKYLQAGNNIRNIKALLDSSNPEKLKELAAGAPKLEAKEIGGGEEPAADALTLFPRDTKAKK